jgi:L-ascorbate metabolism protein UlaG (beta-lactamase superfamily)
MGGGKSHHRPGGYMTPGAPPLPRLRDVLRWSLSRQKSRWPKEVPISPTKRPGGQPVATPLATWINHSTFLLELDGHTVLTDPVFSERAGPGGWLGPRRVHPAGLSLSELPTIDVVLLSHDHYDHCDLPSLKWLARLHQPLGVTLLGNGVLLRRAGFKRVVELDWWESDLSRAGLKITATPSQHWSKRVTSARSSRLWGGFSLRTDLRQIQFVGDTGYHPTFFSEISTRLGPADLALIPIGAYAPRWFMKPQHVNPEEAVQIHRELQARLSLAMHWGTFQLTDEARREPVELLQVALREAEIASDRFRALEPGEATVF